jgi:polygalacturonase
MSLVDGQSGKSAKVRAGARKVVRAIPLPAGSEQESAGAAAAPVPPVAPVVHAVAGAATAASPPFRMPAVRAPKFPARVVDIRDHGAVADAPVDCTLAIAAAIAACAGAGGGRVRVPAGTWSTGPIHLRSNINLHLEAGATLRFSNDAGEYLPPVFVRWGGQECYNYSPLIYARDCTNIAVTGPGMLLGQGRPWWDWEKRQEQAQTALYRMVLDGAPVEQRRFGTQEQPLRPQFILPINCTNVLLEDFTVAEGGPFWTVHLAYCENVLVRRVHIRTPDGPQLDGIAIDSSRNVLIEDCDVHTHGDCITLKSGMNEDGLRIGRPTENVVIRRTRATAGTGAISIGSDMSGGVRNVFVHDCTYDGPRAGIRIKAARGRGGVVEEITFDTITMGRIDGDAIQLTTEYPSFVQPAGKPPVFRNIQIRNLDCRDARSAARMIGLSDSALRNIVLENVTIAADEGLKCTSCSALRLVNVRITPRSGPVLSVRDSQEVLIHGLNHANGASVFLDLRGRQTKGIRLRRGSTGSSLRPTVVLGVDVPKDALVHE